MLGMIPTMLATTPTMLVMTPTMEGTTPTMLQGLLGDEGKSWRHT